MMRWRLSLICLSVLIVLIMIGCAYYPRDLYNIQFYDAACIKPHNQYHYLTCHPIEVKINYDTYVIPKDFDTDLASIPRWYWVLLSPAYSAIVEPSILHDYLYTCPNGMTRLEIDEIYYYSLIGNGVSHYTAYKMYLAVRMFGGKHFATKQCVDKIVHVNDISKSFEYFNDDE